MPVYYNEWEPFCAQWLRNLIKAGHLPDGEVDERSITEVSADDLRGFDQCHFFAGIGGWPYALRLAGWGDRPVWTASCPCQPYSVASVGYGGAQGQGDDRHLWPEVRRLAAERKPATIFGEQVHSAIGWGWWDEAAMDLEAQGYACRALVLRADALGADHERKRLYWVADAGSERWQGHQSLKCLPVTAQAPLAFDGDPLAGAGRALDGDYSHLLPCDGLSVQLERFATKGYGNAIVPQVAAEFIKAMMEVSP